MMMAVLEADRICNTAGLFFSHLPAILCRRQFPYVVKGHGAFQVLEMHSGAITSSSQSSNQKHSEHFFVMRALWKTEIAACVFLEAPTAPTYRDPGPYCNLSPASNNRLPFPLKNN